MKANNLTICINAPCNKNCPYCVSKMTWCPEADDALMCRNIHKAKQMAKLASVSSVLLSSKGEPLNNMSQVIYFLNAFYKFPTELQTNGEALDTEKIIALNASKINTIAFSIDKLADIDRLSKHFETLHRFGINIRLTIVLTNMWDLGPDTFFKGCKELGVKQITFRRSTIPTKLIDTKAAQNTAVWIIKNTTDDHSNFLNYFKREYEPKNLIRELSFGSSVYDIKGIAVTTIDYCMQEHNNTEDIRSLIYHQDGHMYTSWDKSSSILF